jgi:isopenicillin-N epimerase
LNTDLAQYCLIRDGVIFLNHGSYGACPRPVFEQYQRWQLALEQQPVEFIGRKFLDYLLAARTALAAELGTDPDNIVDVLNATEGLNIVIQSLDLKPGDEVLMSDHEYGALEKTWTYVARRTGARIVVAPIPLPLTHEAEFTSRRPCAFPSRTPWRLRASAASIPSSMAPIRRVISPSISTAWAPTSTRATATSG